MNTNNFNGALPKAGLKGLGPFRIPFFRAAVILFACFAVTCAAPARAVVIEPDPDLQRIMGDLHALAVVLHLHHGDTRRTQYPDHNDLAPYLERPLPGNWPADYQIAAIQGDWWVGRRVPEFSSARRFLRDNASRLGLYEQNRQSAWLGGAFVWMKALSFDGNAHPGEPVFRVARGEGDDGRYLFFNSPGTAHYWRSGLIFTADARARAINKFETDAEGPFVVPAAPHTAPETISASPVELPPDFTLGREEEIDTDVRIGDVIFSPIPRTRNH